MLTPADRNRIATNLWTARVIPLVLAGVVGYATYVLVALLCVNYLLVKHNDIGAAAPILVVYFLLFILMAGCFLRLVHVTVADPPYVPLGASALRDRQNYKQRGAFTSKQESIAMGEYSTGRDSGGTSQEHADSMNDPDSPGLELFYTKDAFICSADGKPIWCSECGNWKPDRAHHDSSSGRCIRKMDHFCPWVGGPVGENNMKFFVQFNFYTALYCLHLLIVLAYYIRKQVTTQGESVNHQFIAILVLATFFGLFTASMAGTSLNIAALNLTQVERLGSLTKVYVLAVLKPSLEKSSFPSLGEIKYPLDVSFKAGNNALQQTVTAKAYRSLSRAAADPQDSETSIPTTHLDLAEPTNHTQANPLDFYHQAQSLETDRSQDVTVQTRSSPIVVASSPVPLPSLANGTAPSEAHTARDSKATRTFMILKLQPGDNPWDLGSARLNLETLMGTTILDWLLPLRRSPCCNHEDGEGQFRFGPKVASLRNSSNPDQTRNPLPSELNGVHMHNLNSSVA